VRRILILLAIVAIACVLPLAACGGGSDETTTQPPGTGTTVTGATTTVPATGEKQVIGLCLPAMDNPLMLAISDSFTTSFGEDYDVQVSSADGNANTQASQVENYTTMHAKLICVMAVEATSLLPKLEAARAAGVLTLVIGGEPGESGRDAVMKMDQYMAGEYCALLAKNWVDATYPGAAAGSIETAVFISSLTTESVQRSNGLTRISEPFLKDWEGAYIDATGAAISDKDGKFLAGKTEADRVANPIYCPAVKIVQTPTAEMFQAGQTAMQNVLTTNPDVKLVISYASDGGSGASQAIMDEIAKGSGSVVKDLSKVAVFGVGMFGPEGDAVKAAAAGTGALRGVIAFGGGDLPGKTADLVTKMLNGEDYPAVTWDELTLVTAANGELVFTPMANQGVLNITPLPATGPPAGTTETTVAAAAADSGIVFTDQGGKKVLVEVIPGPGMKFPVSTEGGFASKIEGFDASGASLGPIELPDAAAGILDYSGIAGIAKIVVTDVPHGAVEYEYLIP
jgi:ABC-type sugar transport system substrate-binding protein